MRREGWTGVGRLGLPSPEGSGDPCADIAGTIPDAVAACGAEKGDSARRHSQGSEGPSKLCLPRLPVPRGRCQCTQDP